MPDMKFKTGDIVEITEKVNGHRFKIGQSVMITACYPERKAYDCMELVSPFMKWYVMEHEMKSIYEGTEDQKGNVH